MGPSENFLREINKEYKAVMEVKKSWMRGDRCKYLHCSYPLKYGPFTDPTPAVLEEG